MKRLVELNPRAMDFSVHDGERSHDFLSINSAVSIWAAELDRLNVRNVAFEPNASFASVILSIALFETHRLAVPIAPGMSDTQALDLFRECQCLHMIGGAQGNRPIELIVSTTDVVVSQEAEPRFQDGVCGQAAARTRYTSWHEIAKLAGEQPADLATWRAGQPLRQPNAYFIGLVADVLNGRRIDCFARGLPQRTRSSA